MEMPQLIVIQQALLRYYGNATNSLLHNRNCYLTKENLIYHNIKVDLREAFFFAA
jgi:hypothetical protein